MTVNSHEKVVPSVWYSNSLRPMVAVPEAISHARLHVASAVSVWSICSPIGFIIQHPAGWTASIGCRRQVEDPNKSLELSRRDIEADADTPLLVSHHHPGSSASNRNLTEIGKKFDCNCWSHC